MIVVMILVDSVYCIQLCRGCDVYPYSTFLDAHLNYLYEYERTGKRGKPKTIDGKIDYKELDKNRIKPLNIDGLPRKHAAGLFEGIQVQDKTSHWGHVGWQAKTLLFRRHHSYWLGSSGFLQNQILDGILLL